MLNHFGADNYDEMQIGKLVGVDTTHGTSVEGLSEFFESIGRKTKSHASTTTYFDTVEDFEKFALEKIDNNIPIMVDWVDWAGHR